MKRNTLMLILFLLFTFICSDTIGQGIDFQQIRIDKGMKMAKAQNKNLFILIGTTHCGYAGRMYKKLSKNKACGEFMNKHFISIGYGGTNNEWKKLNRIEIELETVLSYYFYFPGYIFLNEKMEITYFNDGTKRPRKILRYAKRVVDDQVKTPIFYKYLDNNDMHPKHNGTYKMLTYTLKSYLLLEVPDSIDYREEKSFSIQDFELEKNNLIKAKNELEKSLSYDEYYFNCFLASLIYHKMNEKDKALEYAKKGLNNYPKYDWMKSRNLPDKIMKEIVDINI